MSTESRTSAPGMWETLSTHDWSGDKAIETTVSDALLSLDCTGDGKALYDYIDLEAAIETLGPKDAQRGASEIRFDYEDYEIRILQDGTIAARRLHDTPQPQF